MINFSGNLGKLGFNEDNENKRNPNDIYLELGKHINRFYKAFKVLEGFAPRFALGENLTPKEIDAWCSEYGIDLSFNSWDYRVLEELRNMESSIADIQFLNEELNGDVK